jgi:hypothetical protein
VEEVMMGAPAHKVSAAPLAGRADLKRVLHDLDDAAALEILSLQPTVAQIEEAAVWAAGEGHALDRAGRPLTGTVARIVAILERVEDEPDR